MCAHVCAYFTSRCNRETASYSVFIIKCFFFPSERKLVKAINEL
jgi:hypothetical protein